MKAVSWDLVLALPALDFVRETAGAIFNTMDSFGAVVPTVTEFRGTVVLDYEQDGRRVKFILSPEQTQVEAAGDLWAVTDLTKATEWLGRWVAEGFYG